MGDLKEHAFLARVISATHQDLPQLVREGRFRLDLYQRLAGLVIVTPSLRTQLDAEPSDLERLVRFFAERLADEEAAPELTGLALRSRAPSITRGWPGGRRAGPAEGAAGRRAPGAASSRASRGSRTQSL